MASDPAPGPLFPEKHGYRCSRGSPKLRQYRPGSVRPALTGDALIPSELARTTYVDFDGAEKLS